MIQIEHNIATYILFILLFIGQFKIMNRLHINGLIRKRCNSWALAMELHNFCINSLAPGRFQSNFRKVIFKLTLVNGGWGISYKIALRRMPQDLTDDKSILVQVMAWCHQATSHYLSQCWPRSMSPNGVTRPQWVKPLIYPLGLLYWHWGNHMIYDCPNGSEKTLKDMGKSFIFINLKLRDKWPNESYQFNNDILTV